MSELFSMDGKQQYNRGGKKIERKKGKTKNKRIDSPRHRFRWTVLYSSRSCGILFLDISSIFFHLVFIILLHSLFLRGCLLASLPVNHRQLAWMLRVRQCIIQFNCLFVCLFCFLYINIFSTLPFSFISVDDCCYCCCVSRMLFCVAFIVWLINFWGQQHFLVGCIVFGIIHFAKILHFVLLLPQRLPSSPFPTTKKLLTY